MKLRRVDWISHPGREKPRGFSQPIGQPASIIELMIRALPGGGKIFHAAIYALQLPSLRTGKGAALSFIREKGCY